MVNENKRVFNNYNDENLEKISLKDEEEMDLFVILDRSGSMSGSELDTINGFNSFIERQSVQGHQIFVTTILFDNEYAVYEATFNKVIQAEISYLVNEGDQQGSDRLIALINEYPIVSTPAIGTTHDSDIIEGNDKYNAEVGKFNDYCNQILSRAISTKNQYLAEAIVNNFKPTLERKKVDTHFLGNDEYDYQYVETDKEKAKKILKEAIKEGKFNNQD